MKLTPIDSKKELEGSELGYRGATLIVARANNTNFKSVFRAKLKPYQQQLDKDIMDDHVAESIMIESVAETILVGWSGFVDVTGKEWEYNIKNAICFLKDDKDAYEEITSFSEKISNYIDLELGKIVEK